MTFGTTELNDQTHATVADLHKNMLTHYVYVILMMIRTVKYNLARRGWEERRSCKRREIVQFLLFI